MVYSLLYASRSLVQPDGRTPPAVVGDIVEYSRQWNAGNGVTGALVWSPGHFAQILEGAPNTVRMLYAKIGRDRRHAEVTLLDTREVREREFAGWGLAYAGASAYVGDRLERLHELAPRGFDEGEVGALRRLMRELVDAGGVAH